MARDFVKIIGINLTFLLVFTIFIVIVINMCLSIYIFLMTSKFHTYGNAFFILVRLSENFGLFKSYTEVDVKSSKIEYKNENQLIENENEDNKYSSISIEVK